MMFKENIFSAKLKSGPFCKVLLSAIKIFSFPIILELYNILPHR